MNRHLRFLQYAEVLLFFASFGMEMRTFSLISQLCDFCVFSTLIPTVLQFL